MTECKVIWENHYSVILEIHKKLETEMEGFMINSLQLLYIILPYIKCVIKNGKIIKEEIEVPDIFFIEKEVYIPYIKIINKLSYSNKIDEIKNGLEDLNKKIQQYIEEDKIDTLFSQLSDCINGITKEEVIKYYFDNKELTYHEISDLIVKRQKAKNEEPDIKKEDFFELYPDFHDSIDKDGLTNISLLDYKLSRFGIYYEDFFLYFDKKIWEFSSGDTFLNEFFDIKSNYSTETHFKISLDFNRIISRKKYRELILLGGYHYGPDFHLDSFFINQNKTLFTRKVRLNSKFDEYLGYKIFATEFYIDQRDNSFLIEEIGEKKHNEDFVNRLIHSKFNINDGDVSHFDGSLLFYDSYSKQSRENITLDKRPKLSTKKNKLFRIDGKLNFNEFKNITLAFYEGNEMILEYFDIEEYKKTYSHILDYENGIDY